MTSKLLSELDNVSTKDDFSLFLKRMVSDFNDHYDDWENQDLPSFLEAMSGWVEEMDGYYDNQEKAFPNDINWKVIANIFYAAKYYE